MSFATRTILGLAIDERGISCAQVALGRRRPEAQRLARFELPTGTSFDQPRPLGEALRAFLRAHHFTVGRALVGVPARWLIAQERELPPVDEAAAIGMLRLAAERLAVDEMVFDAAGRLACDKPGRVLLVGIPRRRLDDIAALCAAAGLKLVGVGPTAMALLAQVSADEEPLVVVSASGGELIWQSQGVPFMLKHLSAGAGDGSDSAAAAVATDVRRLLLLRPADRKTPDALRLWNVETTEQPELAGAFARSGLRVQPVTELRRSPVRIDPGALNGAAARERPQRYLAALAVALGAGAPADNPPVNFLRPRLAAPKPRRFSRATVLATIAVAAIVLGLGALYYDVKTSETQAAALSARLSGMDKDLKAAGQRLDRFGYGRTYYDRRPPVLDFLRDLTAAFGRDPSIWATGFSLRDNGKGTVHGKAAAQPAALELLKRLKNDGHFRDLQLIDLRAAGGSSRDITFSMSFSYTGARHAQ